MIPLVVVVRHVLPYNLTKMRLAQWDDSVQTLLFDRADETLRIRVQVRALRWQSDRRHPGALENRPELRGEDRVSIVDDVVAIREKPGSGVSEVSGDLEACLHG